ncbi:MAG: hypothetical protein IPG23_05225 [Burkholderiales bacterium]|jgi:hypothetical protein|nr:hypothetical protein [Burkholderiales bacterium]
MFGGFLGKGKKSGKSPTKDAVDSRGLEVVEDDPDTTWGLWEDAVAEQDSRMSPLDVPQPRPDAAGAFLHTVPLPIMEEGGLTHELTSQDLTPAQRRDIALQIVELHHHRIAKSIRSLWGYKECSDYISKLIMDGGDRQGHKRLGFNQDAAQAMMVLSDLHDAEVGMLGSDKELGFADPTVRTGLDGSR